MKVFIRTCELVFVGLNSDEKRIVKEVIGSHGMVTENGKETSVVAQRDKLYDLLFHVSANYDIDLI